MRIIDWSSDVCSSDLNDVHRPRDQDLDGATEEACDEAERDAGTAGDGDDDGAPIEGVARTVDEPRQDIEADGVGDRPSVACGKGVSGRVDIGGLRLLNKHTHQHTHPTHECYN